MAIVRKHATLALMPEFQVYSKLLKVSSIKVCLPSKDVSRQRLSSIEGHLLSKVVFRQRLSSVKGRLPSKVVFHQRSSSVIGCLPSKVIFPEKSSSFKGHLPSMEVFRQRSSSVKGHFWSKVFFQRFSSSTLAVTVQLSRKWIKLLEAWSFRQSACVEILFKTQHSTVPDTNFKIVRGWTIKTVE